MAVRRAFIWSIAGQVVSLVMLLVAMVILARLMSPREMGVFAVGQATGAILSTIGSIGIGAYIIRAPDAAKTLRNSAFFVALGFSIILGGAFLALAKPISTLLNEPGMITAMRWIAILPVIGALETVPLAVAQREMRFGALAVVAAARSTTITAVAIGSVIAGEVYMCVAYAMIAGATVSAVGAHIVAPGEGYVSPRLSDCRAIVRFSCQTFLAGGTGLLASRLSEVVIGALTGLAALGIYSRASTIYAALYASVFGAISRVLLVRLAEAMRRGDSFQANYAAALDALLALFWPALLGIAILSSPIIHLVFGPEWADAALPLSFLMVAQATAMLFSLSYEIAMLRDFVARQVRYEVVRSAAGLVFVVIGCQWGITGAAIGKLCELILAALIYVPFVLKMTGLTASDYIAIVRRNVAPTMAAIAPATLYMCFEGFPPSIPTGALLTIAAAGVPCWVAALAWQHHPLSSEVRQLFWLKRRL